jgi:hypothetical protein
MKSMKKPTIRPTVRGLVLALAGLALSSYVATATPYATCLTNNGDGSVSFRLNQTTTTNDSAWVISGGGTVTNQLQTPGGPVLNRGLITTDTNLFVIPPSTVFQVRIKHTGTGLITTNSPTVPFNAPRGVAVNNRPASPYFGWVYAANGTAGTRGAGMFAFTSDLFDILGQGNTAKDNGYGFVGGGSSPYHTSVAPDDSVLVTDWSDAKGNLISMPPLLNSFSYVLKQLTGTAATPVGAANNHGSVISAFMVGSGANLKLYTMDEDYQTDPTAGAITELNSAWEYDIGTGPLPWTAAPNRKIMTPYLATFSGQNQKCEVYGHYLYSNQRRSNPPQHDVYITDLNNLLNPSTYTGASPWDTIWTSQDESIAEGYSDDVLRDTMTISVSPDQRWLATIIAAGSGTPITAPDGSTFNTLQDDIILIPLTNGIPNLAARQVFHWGSVANGRDLAFDAAHNIYCMSSGLAYMQSLDIGESTDATTGSDGTFVLAQPPTQVTVAATTPVASEAGAVPGAFTITRTSEEIGKAIGVTFNIGGTARANTNYVPISTTTVTLAAGQTSTNILVTPVSDGKPDPVLTVILTLAGAGDYSVGFPSAATVFIADNSTPQLRITGLSTNIFEGTTNDYGAITIQRWGDTNVAVVLDATSFALGGTAVPNVDYYLANLPHTIAAGVINDTFPLIYPIRNQTGVGSRSILVTNVAGTGYTVVSNNAATTLRLESVPPGTVLYSDNFETDTSSAWKVAFQSYTNGSADFTADFNYDYANAPSYNLPAIPPAPHSTNNDTHGLYMTVNKTAGISAGLNLYLKNHTFSHNYALRFDLFLVENSSGTAQSKVENVLFGINHDGNHTNWFRNSVTGTSLLDSPTASDGLFFDIGADGNGGGGAPYDFAAWSGPTWTNTVSVVGPTNFLAVPASSTRQIFKRPPFDSGTTFGGDPANTPIIGGFASPTWVEVEISQQETPNGNLISYKINNTLIMSYFNTSVTHVNTNDVSGTIMVGYCDPWDDIANGSAGSGEGCAIIDNLQVVQLSNLPVIAGPTNTLANVGGSASFAVTASTLTGVTNYQWYLNNVAIAGATGSSLTVNPVVAASFGNYLVTVNDGVYTAWSANATLASASGPVIVTPPSNLTAVVGGSPTFSVTASTSSGTTNYQWTYYGTNLTSATASTLTLANVQAVSFGGPYAVIVSDGFNSITSSPAATLTLASSPTIASPAAPGGTSFVLSFNTQIGPAYVVDFKTNLTDAVWKALKTNSGTGGIITVTNTANSAHGFYRVRLQ